MATNQQLQDEIELMSDKLTRSNADAEEYRKRWSETNQALEIANRSLQDERNRHQGEYDRVGFVQQERLSDLKEIIRWLVNKDTATVKSEVKTTSGSTGPWTAVDSSFFNGPSQSTGPR